MNKRLPGDKLMICSNCCKEKYFKKRSWCRECKAKQLRENRHNYKPESRIKKRARWIAWWHQHVKCDLIAEACEICGNKEVNKHHDDYSKPLDVRWLCLPCHYETHKAERRKAA